MQMSKNMVVKRCCHGNVNVDVHITTTINKIIFRIFLFSSYLPFYRVWMDSAHFPGVKLK